MLSPREPLAACGLCFVCEEFARGRLRIVRSYAVGGRAYVVGHLLDRSDRTVTPLTPIESQVLVRVLCGEQQKVVAADLAVAPSTASHRFLRAVEKLGVADEPLPLPFIIAIQHWAGIGVTSGAELTRSEVDSVTTLVLSIRRPDLRKATPLTAAEREVASLFVDGLSRAAIARARRTSEPTVARQIHSIFTTLQLFGRYALVRRAIELGCFT
jgi:DNA-binding NarL/FixJ family response regulator